MPHLPVSAIIALVLGSSLAVVSAQVEPAPPHHHLVEVSIPDAQSTQRLIDLDLDLVACQGHAPTSKHMEVIATDADLATLRDAGLDFRVAIRHLEQHHAKDLAQFGPFPATLTPPLGQGAMGGHYTLAQMEAILDSFAQNHPGLCTTKVSLGKSIEGRDIWMVKISDNVSVDENEPELMYDALHHAREPVSMATTLKFMDDLLTKYGSDPEITYIVDNRELFFVPCVNPDGYEYNRRTNPGGGGMWRKNRRGGYGIDLNRNYASFWGLNSGSSGSQSSSSYRGTAPFSEPETRAVETFAASRSFVQVVSTHTYTDVLLTPWAYTRGRPEGFGSYDRVGKIATATTGISHTPWWIGLGYLGSGTAMDHHHTARGALSWTPELGRSNEGGFWPNPTRQVNIATRHQPMFRAIAVLSGPNLTDGEVILMTNGVQGSDVKIGMLGSQGATGLLAASAGTANLPVPGVTGNLLLDPASTVWLAPQTFGSIGYITLSAMVPVNPALVGQSVHFQMLHAAGSELVLGNRQTLTVR